MDLNGKYCFTNDAIFNESVRGKLSQKCQALPEAAPHLTPPEPDPFSPPQCSEHLQCQSQLHKQMQLKHDKILQLQVPIADTLPPPLPTAEFLTNYATLTYAESLVHDSLFASGGPRRMLHPQCSPECCTLCSSPFGRPPLSLQTPSIIPHSSITYRLVEVGGGDALRVFQSRGEGCF